MNIEKKDIQYIKTLLTTALNVDFLPYKDSTVMRRVEKRMTALQLTEAKDYISYLKKHKQELRVLGEDIFINVTDFFRDPHVFQKIKQKILPIIFSKKKRTIKFWVAGCATGEEAYSMAILIKEFCEENNYKHKIKIIATDIKEEAINKARQGIYTVKEILGVNRQRLRRFFDREGDKYRIKKHIRSEVIFAIHDITSDPPFARVDLLSCRNLLIYLDKENQQKVLASLVFALNIEGFLVLGKSETAIDLSYDLKNISSIYKIYKRIKNPRTTRRLNFDISYQDSLLPILVTPSENETGMKEHELVKSFQHIIHQKYAPAVVIIDEQFYVKHITHPAKQYIDTPEDYTKIYSLTTLAPEAITALVRAAISEIKKGKKNNIYPSLPITYEGQVKQVSIAVESLSIESDSTSFYSIIFEEQYGNGKASVDVAKRINLALQSQLADTEVNLQKTIEKLENTNQNLLASNEELQSTNEEYISVNEELQTINSEYQETIDELSITNKDVDHLLQSTDIGTVFLDDELHIRKFTNPIKNLINIDHIDLKRPLKNFTHNIQNTNIYKEVKAVRDSNQAIEKEVVSENDIYYLMRATPYDVDEEDRKGIVLSFINIQQLKDAEKALAESELLYRSVFNYANDGIVLVDENEKEIRNVNQKQLQMLGYTKEEYLKSSFFDIFTESQSDGQKIKNKVKRYSKTKNTHHAIEWTLKRKDNTIIETEISTVNMPSPYEGYTLNIIRDVTQRKQAQAKILASKKYFEAVFDNCPVGVGISGIKSRKIIRVNKTFGRMTGYTPKQLSQMSFIDITYHEDRQRAWECLKPLLSGKKKIITFDKRYVKKNGKIFWARLWVSIMDDGSGEKFFVSSMRDITKEKASEKATKDSELRYRSLFEKNLQAVLIYDIRENKISSVNKSACKLFECSKKYLLEHTPMDFFPKFQDNGEPSMQFFGRQMHNYTQTGEIRHFMQLQTKKGKRIEVEVTAFALYDSPDSPMVVQFKDITAQKNAQKALKISEQRFRSLFENSADSLAILDTKTMAFIDCNEHSLKLFRTKKKDVIGLHPLKLSAKVQIDGRTKFEHSEEFIKIVNEKGHYFIEKWVSLRLDGTTFYSEFSLTKLPAPDEHIYILEVRDITEKLQAQQALQDSEQRFRNIYENSGDAIVLKDLTQQNATQLNSRFTEMTGYTEEDFEKLDEAAITLETQADGRSAYAHHEEHMKMLNETGYCFVENWLLKHKDGHIIRTDMSISKLYDDREDALVIQFRDVTEKYETQQAIKVSEERFRSVYQNSGEAILLENITNSRVLDCNSKVREITGYTEADFGKITTEHMVPEFQQDGRTSLAHFEEQEEIILEKGSCFVEDFLLKHKDGHLIWTDMSLSKLYDDYDDIIIVQFRDVTERHQAQQAIKEREQRFSSLFEHSADAVSIIDSKTHIFLSTNRKSVEMFGYNKEELMSKTPMDLSAAFQVDGRPVSEHIQELIDTVNKHGYYFIDNWINKRADNSEFYSELSVTNFPAPNEHIFIIQRRDVTEKRQAQQEIQKQKDYLRTIIDYIPLIVTVKDTEGNYLLTNQISTEAFGMSVDEVIGKNDKQFKSRYGWRNVLESDKKVIEAGEILHINNVVAERPNGEIRHVQATKVPIKNENGEVIQILTVINDITEIKIAEKLLEEQKNYLNTIINRTPSMITAKDKEGNFMLANQAAAAIYGVPSEELIGKNRKAFDFGFGWEKSLAGDQKVIESGEMHQYDDAILNMANGDKRIVHVTKVPLKNDDGETIQVLAVSKDITKSKATEKLLKEQKDYLRTIIDLTPNFIFSKNINGEFILVNKAIAGIYGITPNDMQGKTDADFNPNKEEVAFSLQKDREAMKNGKIVHIPEETITTAAGETKILQTTKVPIFNDNGDCEQMLGISIDITESKRIERNLRESQVRFKAVFENSYSIIGIVDAEGIMIEQNKPFEAAGTANAITGKPMWESPWFFHDKKIAKQIKKDFQKALKGEYIINQCTYMGTPDTIGYMSYSLKPVYLEEGGELLFMLAESRDITDLMLAQKELGLKVDELNNKNEELKKYINSNMQLENFAYITSHDLREPLRTISGFANLLERKYIGKLDETADEYLGYILTSTKNMNALIEDLLIFSRVHTGEHRVEKFDLEVLVKQVIKSLDSAIKDTRAIVTYENIPNTINANETKMKQLFQNLIANAIKFRKPDTVPEVKIVAKSKGEFWEFSVQDNGIGISEEYFDKIFMIFKRLHTKDEYDGTGIGLSLCKKIVEQHGGEISLESQKGEGTTFYFTIEK